MHFALMGPLILVGETGEQISLPGLRQRALLAALLLNANRPVSIDALAEAVWDGAPPKGHAATLRSGIRRLRGVLGPDAARIAARYPGYLITVDETELDILQFESLCRQARTASLAAAWPEASDAATRALGLWRGEPLSDISSRVLRDTYTPWLEQLREQVLEDRIEADLRSSRHDLLVPELRDLAKRHPLRERFHIHLMLALVRCGRTAEALEAYQAARRVLIEHLGIEPGAELKALHKRILAGDDALATPRAEPSPRAGRRAVPRQLPAAVAHFAGREAEMKALSGLPAHTDPVCGVVVISAIDGMAGVGKTTLAIRVAHLLAEQFPDGQLFIDLHGYTRGLTPRDPADALATILQAYGISPARIPADLEARAALYRDHLSATRTLVLLDNAASEAQVRPLLPGSGGCMVLVTSRRRLKALDGAYSMPLDVLSVSDAVALLVEVAELAGPTARDPLLEDIAALCGCLPLALRIVASFLRHHPSWTVRHLADKLRTASPSLSPFSDGDRDLSALLDLSYQSLDESHRRLYRHLGLIPGPDADCYAAAALLDDAPPLAGRLLEDLVDHNLLTEPAPGRYRFHDLLRHHARTLAEHGSAEVREAAAERLLNYYQYTAVQADACIAPHLRSEFAGSAPAHAPDLLDAVRAREWLRAERVNLLACIEYAAAQSQDERVVAMSAGVAALLLSDGPWPTAIAVHTAAAAAAERLGDRTGRARALTALGAIRRVTGNHAQAVSDLEEALALSRALDDPVWQARALATLGPVRQVSGDCPGAMRDLEEAKALFRGLGDRAGEARVLTFLGTVRLVTGDYAGAIRDLEVALTLFAQVGDRAGRAHALTDLGALRQAIRDYAGAARDLGEALGLYRDLGNRHGESVALNELGAVRRMTGDHAGAVRDLETALALCRDMGNRNGQALSLGHLGAVRRTTGDYRGALHDLETALDLFRQIGSRGNEAWALNLYAAVFASMGDYERALDGHRRALRLAREVGMPDEQALALEGIGECCLCTGHVQDGAAHLRQALTIFQRLALPDAERVGDRLAALDSS